jgi:cytosine/adenosine deaminase-related metal-dependent hydrolase
MLDSLPAFVNAHTHGPIAPYKGLTRSRPFEMWFVERAARQAQPPTPEDLAASALVTGLENLAAGNSAIVDHVNAPQTKAHIYAIARAYELLGIRAWVLVDATDLPRLCYTREAYPRYARAVPTADLPAEMQPLVAAPRPYQEQLAAIREIITGWEGTRVRLGLALSNPTWCSDELLAAGASLARELDVPIAVHAEESPIQREVCLAQWGVSGIRRLERFGVLTPRTIVAHAVQVDDDDVKLLARSGAAVAHNPLSNLKLQNGIAPVGKMLAAGINVCLGSDGASSGDDQSLFPVIRVVAALAGLNGLRTLPGDVEETVLRMATEHGRRLWWDGDPATDRIHLAAAVGPYAPVWSDLAPHIVEVSIEGERVLARARDLVREQSAATRVGQLAAEAMTPEAVARAEQFARAVNPLPLEGEGM